MAAFNPELIRLMRTVLEEVMTRVPVEQATPGIKAHLAEIILKAAAQGIDLERDDDAERPVPLAAVAVRVAVRPDPEERVSRRPVTGDEVGDRIALDLGRM